MRRGDGGGPFRQLLSMIATLVMVGVLVVVLVSSGGWRTVSETLGVGNPDASTAALAESKKGDAGRNPDAKSLSGLLSLFGVHTGGEADAGAKDTGKTPDTAPTGDAAAWRAQLDAAGRIGTADARPGGYDRETRFGGWAPSGCGKATTRDTILARDLTGVRKDSSCRVVSGTLRDPYTGRGIGFR
ncbi:HNH endonuclease, partial [Bifidobacterium longum]